MSGLKKSVIRNGITGNWRGKYLRADLLDAMDYMMQSA
jgi:hypothetical protein